MDLTGERHRALLRRADLAGWRPRQRGPGHPRLRRADRVQDRAVGAGPGLPAAARPARRARRGQRGAGQRRLHPPGGGVRQAGLRRPGGIEQDPRFADVPLGALLSRAYAVSAARWSARRPQRSCGRAAGRRRATATGLRRGRPGGRTGSAGRSRARRRAARRPARREAPAPRGRPAAPPQRYLPSGRRRPVRRRGAPRPPARLAAQLASRPGLGFCLGTRGQMFHPDPRPAEHPGARQAAPHRPVTSLALRDGRPTWRSAPPAGTSRTSRPWASSCGTCWPS